MAENDLQHSSSIELEIEYLEQKLRFLELETKKTTRKLRKYKAGHLKEKELTQKCDIKYFTGRLDKDGVKIHRGDFVRILTASKGKTAKLYGVSVARVSGTDQRNWIELVSLKDSDRQGVRAPENIRVLARNADHYKERVERKEIKDISEKSK